MTPFHANLVRNVCSRQRKGCGQMTGLSTPLTLTPGEKEMVTKRRRVSLSLNFKLTGIDRGASGRTRNHGKTAAFLRGTGTRFAVKQTVGMPIYWPAWKPGWRWSASGAAIPGCAALSPKYRVFARSAARSTEIAPERERSRRRRYRRFTLAAIDADESPLRRSVTGITGWI